MRIAPSEAQVIAETARAVFGQRVAVWLFGSRTDDAKKGGDIDLYVELPPQDYTYAKPQGRSPHPAAGLRARQGRNDRASPRFQIRN